MQIVDTLILVVLLFFGALGIYWGVIRQVLAVVGLIAGIALAGRYGSAAGAAFSSFIANDTVAQALGFIFVFFFVSSLSSLLASLLQRFVGLLFLSWLDHLLGGLLGLFQGALACSAILIVAAMFPHELWSSALAESRYAPVLVRLFGGLLLALLPESFRFPTQRIFGLP